MFCLEKDSKKSIRLFVSVCLRCRSPCFDWRRIQRKKIEELDDEIEIVVVLVLIGEGFKEPTDPKLTIGELRRSPCFDWRRIQRKKLNFLILTVAGSRSPCFDWRRIQSRSVVFRPIWCFYVVVLVLIGEGFKVGSKNRRRMKKASRSPCFDWRRIQSELTGLHDTLHMAVVVLVLIGEGFKGLDYDAVIERFRQS